MAEVAARGRRQSCDACGGSLSLQDDSWQGVNQYGVPFLLCRTDFGCYPEMARRRVV